MLPENGISWALYVGDFLLERCPKGPQSPLTIIVKCSTDYYKPPEPTTMWNCSKFEYSGLSPSDGHRCLRLSDETLTNIRLKHIPREFALKIGECENPIAT